MLAVGGGMSLTVGSSVPIISIATIEGMFWLYCKVQHMVLVGTTPSLRTPCMHARMHARLALPFMVTVLRCPS